MPSCVEEIMKKFVLPVVMVLLITISLACGLPSLPGLSASKSTTTPNPPGPGSTRATASPKLTLEEIALQPGDLKPGFVKGQTQTQTDEPGETAKQVTGSQPLTLPQPMGDEYYVFRGSGSLQSVGIGWRYHNAYIHVSYVGGTALSPQEIAGMVTPIQTRLAGSQIAFLGQKKFGDPIEVDVIGKDGKNQRSLTAGFQAVFGGLSWSPDGQKILFAMRGDGKSLEGPFNPSL
jgi:hypothetical protein